MTIIAPAMRRESGCELVLHLLSNEVIDLHPVYDLTRQRDVIGCDDRRVVFPRLARW
jgi:hypothetical protein